MASADGVVPWLVLDDHSEVVEPIRAFRHDFVARGNRPGSVRSYAYGLLRWWRWIRAVDVTWDRASSAEVRDLLLWLHRTTKPQWGLLSVGDQADYRGFHWHLRVSRDISNEGALWLAALSGGVYDH